MKRKPINVINIDGEFYVKAQKEYIQPSEKYTQSDDFPLNGCTIELKVNEKGIISVDLWCPNGGPISSTFTATKEKTRAKLEKLFERIIR